MERAIADYQKTGDFEALGYLTKKELYKRTGDKKFLQRTPSFNDPAVLKNLADIVRASARNKARYNMDYYFVGDEGSLTSYGDAADFDFLAIGTSVWDKAVIPLAGHSSRHSIDCAASFQWARARASAATKPHDFLLTKVKLRSQYCVWRARVNPPALRC